MRKMGDGEVEPADWFKDVGWRLVRKDQLREILKKDAAPLDWKEWTVARGESSGEGFETENDGLPN